MSRGFSIVELVIVIAIIAIVISLAVPVYIHYQQKSRIENDTHRLYATVKELQLKAKTLKKYYCFELKDSRTLYIVDSDDCSASGGWEVKFLTPYESNRNYFRINPLGVFNTYGNIHAIDGDGATVDCIKIHTFRVCEGKWNGTACNCVF